MKTKNQNQSWIQSTKLPTLHTVLLCLPVLALLALTPGSGLGQTYTILHQFDSADGARPYGNLALSGTTLYGMAGSGSDRGTVFKINTDGTGFAVLVGLTQTEARPHHGTPGIALVGNALFGGAAEGPTVYGSLFRIGTDGAGFTVIKYFSAADGWWPEGNLVASGETLYGTVSSVESARGSVFRINTNGTGFAHLKQFQGGSDGSWPQGGLLLAGSTLYGTTSGEDDDHKGTVFKVNTDGSGYAVLKFFTGPEGQSPQTGLVLSGDTLCGTTLRGGSGYNGAWYSGNGTVFRLNTNGAAFSVVHYFSPNDGTNPMATLTLAGDTLYGTTTRGGSSNCGTIFQLRTDGGDFAVLKQFSGADGSSPQSPLILSEGKLYGATAWGGTGSVVGSYPEAGAGVLFSLQLPLTFVLQPISQTVPPGTTVAFEAQAIGQPPLVYQWFFNGTNVIGAATSPLLTLTNAQFSHAGGYSVVVTNGSGSVTSLVATLTVEDPCITTQPVSQSVNVGASVAFNVAAGGTRPLGYQWFKGGSILSDGENISGTQTPTVTLNNVVVGDAGGYSVCVSNASGSVTSVVAALQVVLMPPYITNQPVSCATNLGATVQFSVVAGGTPPLSYQWFKGGTVLNDGGNISGAQTPTLTLANVVGGDAGGYSVLVSNASGTVTSLVATLQVIEPPFITSQPASRSANFGATVQFSVVAGGTPPLSYQWFKGVTNASDGGNISGALTSTLTLANLVNRDSGGYSVRVSSPYGSVTSLVATLSVADPWITAQPASQVVLPGQSVVFSVVAVGTPPLSYQWRKDGVNLTGRTTATLTLANAQATDMGNYDVLVGSLYGPVSSDVATLTVVPQTSGEVDLTFDPGSSLNGQVRGLAVQTNGSFILVGNFTVVPGAMRNHAARFNADGSLDPAFAPTFAHSGGPFLNVASVALQSDGKILIGGSFTSVNGVPRSNLVRFNPDGSLDNSFLDGLPGPSGPVGTTVVGKIVVQSDGKILIAGSFTSIDGMSRTNLARLNADGSGDLAFRGTPNGRVASLAIQNDGRILISGDFTLVNGVSRPKLARLQADGSLDVSFLNGLAGPDGWAGDVAVQTDGRVLITGLFQAFNGVAKTNLARLNFDGTLDETFLASVTVSPHGIGPFLALQGDGRILIGGGFALVNGVGRTNLARLYPDGSLDGTFLAQLPSLDSSDAGVSAFAVQPNGKVLAIGYSILNFANPYLVRLNEDGSADNGFSLQTGPDGGVSGLAVQPDGRLPICGGFDSVSGATRGHVARLLTNGALDSTFLEGLTGADTAVFSVALQSDGQVLIAGQFNVINGVARRAIARLNEDGSLDTAFAPSVVGSVYALAIQRDGRIFICGSFTSVNGLVRTNLVRLNSDGSTDVTFVTPAWVSQPYWAGIEAIVLQPDDKIVVGGGFNQVNGVTRNHIARLNSDGSLDVTFLDGQSGTSGGVNGIALQPDGKLLVGGYFGSFNGAARNNLARLNPDGTLDISFLSGLAGPNGGVENLVIQSDGKILVGGGFGSVNGVARGNLARLNANGSLDRSFLEGLTGADQTVRCLAQLADGNIVIGGDFSAVNQVPRRGVARLMSGYTPPAIATPAPSQTVEEGNGVTLRISFAGYPPPAIQWFRNGMALAGCTNSTLELSNAQAAYSGAYTVVATNVSGAVTSAPALLSVIPVVERRPVPGLLATGEPGGFLNLDGTDAFGATTQWLLLDTVSMTATSQWCFDASAPLPPRRFYRAWQTGQPSVPPYLKLPVMIPALTVTGTVGSQVRVEGINAIGPTDAWFTLDTVTLTNTSQIYFDVSVVGKPQRLYRLVPEP